MTIQTRAHIGVLFTNFFFALNLSLVQYISPEPLGPYGVNLFRVAGSLLLFWMMAIVTRSKEDKPIRKEDWVRLALCGFTGIFLNQTLFIKGLTMTSTIHAALLMLSTPLVITGLAVFFLKEKLRLIQAIGLMLGLAGAAVLITDRTNMGADSLLGDGFILINAISYAIYFIIVKPLMQYYPPSQVVRWVFTFGAIGILPMGLPQALDLHASGMHLQQIMALITIVIFGTYFAYSLNIRGIQVLGAGVTGSYIYSQPIFATIIAILFLNDHPTPGKWLAAALIFLGVYLNSRKKVEKMGVEG
jgi:drug/metabolite transporter (DMT)-like permease